MAILTLSSDSEGDLINWMQLSMSDIFTVSVHRMTNHKQSGARHTGRECPIPLQLGVTLEAHLSRRNVSGFHFSWRAELHLFMFLMFFSHFTTASPWTIEQSPPLLYRLTENGQSTISTGQRKPVIFDPVIISITGLAVSHNDLNIQITKERLL